MPYFANLSQTGPVKYRDVPGSVGVLEALDKPMPIGQADCKTWDEHGGRFGRLPSAASRSRAGGSSSIESSDRRGSSAAQIAG
jgi:hypothetical protein